MESILGHLRPFRSRRLRVVTLGVLIVGAVVIDLVFSTQAALPMFILIAAVELILLVSFVRDRVTPRRSNKKR